MKIQVEKPISEGRYIVEVHSILASEEFTNQPVKIFFKLVDLPDFDREVYGTISGNHQHKIVEWTEALLGKQISGKTTVDLMDLIGKRARAKLNYTATGNLRVYDLRPLINQNDPRRLLGAKKIEGKEGSSKSHR